MVDILSFIVQVSRESDQKGQLHGLYSKTEFFKKAKVGTVSDLSCRDPWVPIPKGSSLATLFEIIAKQRVHRVPIMNSKGNVIQLITQSDVIQFVGNNMEKFGPNVCKTLEELRLGSSPVVQVDIDGIVKDALELMVEKKVSAVAVVDKSFNLIATLSVKDLRTISCDNQLFHKMNMKIRDFLGEVVDPRIDAVNPAISCSPKDTLGMAISKLMVTRVHRIFLVNQARKPIAVLSLSDVLGAVMLHSGVN